MTKIALQPLIVHLLMEIRKYLGQDRNQWNDFVKTSKNGFFMFNRGYMDYHADRFIDHSLLAYDDQGKLTAILPANEKGGVLYSHQGLTFGGFITGKKMRMPIMLEVFKVLKDYAQTQHFEKIIYKAIPYFYHRQPAQEDLYALFRAGAKCYRVDVSSTIDYTTARYAFSSSRKSGLKKAHEANLQIRENTNYPAFFDMMNAVLTDKYETKATHNAEEMSLLQSRFPENIKLYGCYQGDDMLAGIIIYETDRLAHTQYIASTEWGKAAGATDLLLEHLIGMQYVEKRYFDFGISTEDDGGHLNDNLISQKEGAGARATVHQFYEINV